MIRLEFSREAVQVIIEGCLWLRSMERKLDQILENTAEIMAKQEDFQARIDQINENTSASAEAAAAIAQNLTDLKAKLDQVLTDAGVPADQERQILDSLAVAADTSGKLRTFLQNTAAGGAGSTEPKPVTVPNVPSIS